MQFVFSALPRLPLTEVRGQGRCSRSHRRMLWLPLRLWGVRCGGAPSPGNVSESTDGCSTDSLAECPPRRRCFPCGIHLPEDHHRAQPDWRTRGCVDVNIHGGPSKTVGQLLFLLGVGCSLCFPQTSVDVDIRGRIYRCGKKLGYVQPVHPFLRSAYVFPFVVCQVFFSAAEI